MTRSLMAGLLAAGCLTAAAGGSYIAVRQNAAVTPVAGPTRQEPVTPATPVEGTEGVIEPGLPVSPEPPAAAEPPAFDQAPAPATPDTRRRVVPAPQRREPRPPVVRASRQTAPVEAARVPFEPAAPYAAPETPRPADPGPAVDRSAELSAPEPAIEEVVIPASAVIGLELETTVSSERARIEDRVDARVTRDVYADGRLALPAGSRVIGVVTLVERGGKVKERARLGVRFHTVVLASGRQTSLRTETIFRDGESPAAESSRKIGGAAIGGAVLGAILGGGKGAVAGATAGAAGGTAAVMAGDRNHAVLPGGSVVTVKLAAPVVLDVER